MCRYVIGRGAHCNKPDSYGNTPMYWAAYNGHLEICKLLYLNGGAQEDIRTLDTFEGAPLRSTTSAAQPPKWYREKYRWLGGALSRRGGAHRAKGTLRIRERHHPPYRRGRHSPPPRCCRWFFCTLHLIAWEYLCTLIPESNKIYGRFVQRWI